MQTGEIPVEVRRYQLLEEAQKLLVGMNFDEKRAEEMVRGLYERAKMKPEKIKDGDMFANVKSAVAAAAKLG